MSKTLINNFKNNLMNMHRIYFVFIIAIITSTLSAQPVRETSFEQKMEAAIEAEGTANYAGALDWYEQAYDALREASRSAGKRSRKKLPKDKDPKVMLKLKIADLCYTVRDYEKAEKYYESIVSDDVENIFPDSRMMYAKTLKAQGKYNLALDEFKTYIASSTDQEAIRDANNEVTGIKLIEELDPNIETGLKPIDKAVNSGSGEFSPRQNPADGNLYFGSFDRSKEIEIDSEDDEFHAKIFMSEIDKEGKINKKKALKKTINRKGFHSKDLAFSDDGKTLYITRVQTTGTEITSSKILRSNRKDTGWSPADPIQSVNGEWKSTNPAVGQLYGKSVIFFTSDMPGGLGGMDLYYANINGDGGFSSPVNLGEGINSSKDEVTPYYHDGTLYYSTNGKPTIGGFDIYYSTWDGSAWSTSTNIGLGYNSSYDDLYFSMNGDSKSGYFVSNRPVEGKKKLRSKSCCDDVFQFRINELVIDLLATVTDGEEGLNGATIKLENITDPAGNPTDLKYNALGSEFQFVLGSDYNYKAVITADGYYPDSILFNTAGIIDNYTVKKTINLKPIPKEPEMTEVVEIVKMNQPIRLNNIYYDLDDYKILPDAEQDLNKMYDLLIKYPDMVIELSSHTDSQGRSSYNEQLSQKRAESATKWILNRGIKKKRIKPVGYGESQIINHCRNGAKCSDDEHRQNRRTEFKIIAGPKTIEITKEVKKVIEQG